MKVAVVCGGTGGHMFPGLATAEELAKTGSDVRVVLSGRDVENVSGWDGGVIRIKFDGVPRWRGPVRAAKSVHSIGAAVRSALHAFRDFQPDAVLAMGSYASIGPAIAAWLMKVPLVIHESNAVPGYANRFMSLFSSAVCVAFDEAAAYLPKRARSRVRNTGMPIRGSIGALPHIADDGSFTVVVMGGSQGAAAVNSAAVDAFCRPEFMNDAGFRLIHIAGGKNEEQVRTAYRARGASYEVLGFTDKMPEIYASADLVVSRAGAASCFELCKCGLPSILVPLPRVSGDHQSANAGCMRAWGVSEVIAQDVLSGEVLSKAVLDLKVAPEKLAAMGKSGIGHFKDGAASLLAGTVASFAARGTR